MCIRDSSKLIEIQDKPTTPIFTFMMMFAMLGAYSLATLQRMDWWLSHNSYQQQHMLEMLHKLDFVGILTVTTLATFASFHIVQMAFNIYFLWVFAKHTEQKLGPGRFLLLLMIAIYLPWFMTYFDLLRQPELTHMYILSPAMMLCAIIGCYMAVSYTHLPRSICQSLK